ncbi:hypothetical protein M2390_002884 [Mycetocola sp. BIGb0189]|uniref:hypothetical protein n=1 Tax=Mycetocola sp. BIGb0189 TaxID=2940604 RepID=UPI002167AA8B|nr:hypothetical protein [Mycetocola sp. BIGb0189]MCS4277675.1 hypothetical protein [Mycetocola sp. BIGb0189]
MSARPSVQPESFRERKRAVVDVTLLVCAALGILVGIVMMTDTPWDHIDQSDHLRTFGGDYQRLPFEFYPYP